MKRFLFLLSILLTCFTATANMRTYIGSTPADATVRAFLGISTVDSIDFIRWKMDIGPETFSINCQYGLCNPGTPGFRDEQKMIFEGRVTRSGNYYNLKHKDRSISILEVNENVLYLLDHRKNMLTGNGGWSYALNRRTPVTTEAIHIRSDQKPIPNRIVFEGRTPCQELSALLGLNKRDACNKMKWLLIFYRDSVTGNPSHFLMNGMEYREETMAKGKWQIITGDNNHIIYRLYLDRWSRPLDLQQGDDNILFFTDADGRLMVGNEDFSYSLNRRTEPFPRRKT